MWICQVEKKKKKSKKPFSQFEVEVDGDDDDEVEVTHIGDVGMPYGTWTSHVPELVGNYTSCCGR